MVELLIFFFFLIRLTCIRILHSITKHKLLKATHNYIFVLPVSNHTDIETDSGQSVTDMAKYELYVYRPRRSPSHQNASR